MPGTASSLVTRLLQGDRAALSKSITLIESTRSDHRRQAEQLLSTVLAHSRSPANRPTFRDGFRDTFRIGLSGAPGVGKSSFIERFGMSLIERGHRVAVLSHKASGFDIILVETVGVGQSETMVAEMVDLFALLVAPGAGDELQGMKKGIVEMSDIIIVNKSDGVLETPARMAQMEYISALKFTRSPLPTWTPSENVLRVSSHSGTGLDVVWDRMKRFYSILKDTDLFHRRRGEQRRKSMWNMITEELLRDLKASERVRGVIPELEAG
ncbi:hypothetical protein HK101_006236, partial [Irineochytrium annulatum]